jgi:hypothetical protein
MKSKAQIMPLEKICNTCSLSFLRIHFLCSSLLNGAELSVLDSTLAYQKVFIFLTE